MLKRILIAAVIAASALTAIAIEARAATSGRWTVPSTAPTRRDNGAQAVLGDGRILVAGGVAESAATAKAEMYNLQTSTWTALPDMHVAKWYPLAAPLAGNRVLVVGQADFANHPVGSATYEVFDSSTNSWSPVQSFPSTSTSGRLVPLSTGKVLYAATRSDTSLYDPQTDAWTVIGAPWYDTVAVGSATTLANGKVLVTTTDGFQAPHSMSVFLFDPLSETWAQLPTPGFVSGYLRTTRLADGRVLAFGDKYNFTTNSLDSTLALFEPNSFSWRLIPIPTEQLHEATFVATPAGTALAVGGETFEPQDNCSCWSARRLARTLQFDGSTETWTQEPDLHEARSRPQAVTTSRGVLAIGGQNPYSGPASSEEFIPDGAVAVASIADAQLVERRKGGVYDMDFVVRLEAPATTPLVINATTSDQTATGGADYIPGGFSVSFAVGQRTATLRVPIIGDKVAETDETFGVTLESTDAVFTDPTAIGTIIDDDFGACPVVASRPYLCVGVQDPRTTIIATLLTLP
jgi:hypothetical protein